MRHFNAGVVRELSLGASAASTCEPYKVTAVAREEYPFDRVLVVEKAPTKHSRP